MHIRFSIALNVALGMICTLTCADSHAQEPVLTVRADIKLDPAQKYSAIEVLANGVTIDGNGAIVEGDLQVNAKDRKGIGVLAVGIDGVTLKNLKVHGFGTGLRIEKGKNWVVENCDFSENASDPEFEWGVSAMEGGIRLNHVSNSTIRNCTAHGNWNNCDLFHCQKLTIEACDFSHASNLCLRMRASTSNTIVNNKLMYGIRIRADEVHARDSSCVLLEGGCHDNHLKGNDCRYGGDGIFIRAIGSSISTRNLIEENDCSFANNNAIECGSPGNRFVRNRANHSSYGLWLGGSDRTEIIDNEVCFNGLATGFHNSPHLPNEKHAGIIYMFATAQDILIRGNQCIGNNGAGIALLQFQSASGELLSPSNVTIEGNRLLENDWGIHLVGTNSVRIANNLLQRNRQNEIDLRSSNEVLEQFGNVDADYLWKATRPEPLKIDGPVQILVGQTGQFRILDRTGTEGHATAEGEVESNEGEVSASPALGYKDDGGVVWMIDGVEVSRDSYFTYTATKPGVFSLAAHAVRANIATVDWTTVAVVDAESPDWNYTELPDRWQGEVQGGLGWEFSSERQRHLIGDSCLRIDINPYHGARATCHCDIQPIPVVLSDKSHISFWFDAEVTAAAGWQDSNPEIVLTDEQGNSAVYSPQGDILRQVPDSKLKLGWRLISFNLSDHRGWSRKGGALENVARISLGFDTWEHDPISIWIDGLQLSELQTPSPK